MRINPTLLLLLILIFIFSPSIHEWMTQAGTAWYRPYIIWAATVAFIYWAQRGRKFDEV